MKSLKDRAPELFKTLHESEEDTWRVPAAYSTPAKPPRNGYDVYEPPTRLRDTTPTTHVIRRGSNSSNDYSESYHTQSRNDDPIRPSVTDTYQSFSKKTVPSRDGRFDILIGFYLLKFKIFFVLLDQCRPLNHRKQNR